MEPARSTRLRHFEPPDALPPLCARQCIEGVAQRFCGTLPFPPNQAPQPPPPPPPASNYPSFHPNLMQQIAMPPHANIPLQQPIQQQPPAQIQPQMPPLPGAATAQKMSDAPGNDPAMHCAPACPASRPLCLHPRPHVRLLTRARPFLSFCCWMAPRHATATSRTATADDDNAARAAAAPSWQPARPATSPALAASHAALAAVSSASLSRLVHQSMLE